MPPEHDPGPRPEARIVEIERLAVNAQEAADLLGISLRKFDELVLGGQIPCVRIGRARRFRVESLRDWCEAAERGGRR